MLTVTAVDVALTTSSYGLPIASVVDPVPLAPIVFSFDVTRICNVSQLQHSFEKLWV